MRRISSFIVGLAVLLIVDGRAAAQTCPAVDVRNPDGNYIIPGVKGDIPYSGALALDAYVQRGSLRPPSVIVIHGGAWTSGSRIAHVGQILEALTRAGYNWFSVDYRLPGLARFEDSLADLRAALAFVRCRAADFGIDPDQLVLLGEDSGAHLASLLAAERPAGVIGGVLLGGFYDPGAMPAFSRDGDPDLLARAAPIGRIGPTTPPLLVIHGGADDEVPTAQARLFCAAVAGRGGRCQFVEVAGASHRSENWWPPQWTYKRAMVDWLSSLSRVRPGAARPQDSLVRKDILYSPSAQLRLDAYVPHVTAPTPAVIVVHGGGWEAGDKVTYVTPLFEPLARAGVAWFSIDYRLTPAFTHEQQLDDLRHAVRFVRREHRRFNIDPTRIVLVGESASGQMVTLIGAEDSSLAGVVSFYGVYDFTAMVSDASPRSLLVRLFRRTVLDDAARSELQRYSPLFTARKDMPPLLMVNGTGERLWAQAQAFSQRLTAIGARHELVALEGAPHGMENWEGHPEWMSYKRRVVEWIQQVTRH
jgi:acetyl esterase